MSSCANRGQHSLARTRAMRHRWLKWQTAFCSDLDRRLSVEVLGVEPSLTLARKKWASDILSVSQIRQPRVMPARLHTICRTYGGGRRDIQGNSEVGRIGVHGSFAPHRESHCPFSYLVQHMRSFAGPSAHVHFTHLSKSSCQTLSALFSGENDTLGVARATAHSEPILDIIQGLSIPLEKVCLLDPKAENEIAPEDGDGRFECFLFGVCVLTLSCLFASLTGILPTSYREY